MNDRAAVYQNLTGSQATSSRPSLRAAAPAVAKDAGLILGGFAALACIGAGAVALTQGAQARAALDFGFAGVPQSFGEATAIFLNNAKVACLLACVVALIQLRPLIDSSRWRRAYTTFCDILICTPAVVNTVVLAITIGAYGGRMLKALVPHGPVELAGVALVGALYVHARRGDPDRRLLVAGFLTALLLIAAAALLETYVQVLS